MTLEAVIGIIIVCIASVVTPFMMYDYSPANGQLTQAQGDHADARVLPQEERPAPVDMPDHSAEDSPLATAQAPASGPVADEAGTSAGNAGSSRGHTNGEGEIYHRYPMIYSAPTDAIVPDNVIELTPPGSVTTQMMTATSVIPYLPLDGTAAESQAAGSSAVTRDREGFEALSYEDKYYEEALADTRRWEYYDRGSGAWQPWPADTLPPWYGPCHVTYFRDIAHPDSVYRTNSPGGVWPYSPYP